MSGFSVLKTNRPHGTEIVEVPFDSGQEVELESLIEDYPDTLPITEINPTAKIAVPIGRQVTVGTNFLDLLFIDDTGSLFVVECKLIQNPEARREVLAQLLEYALTIETSWDTDRVRSVADEYLTHRGFHDGLISYLNKTLSDQGHETVNEKSFLRKMNSRVNRPYLIVAGNELEQRALVLSDYLRKLKRPVICVEFRRFRIRDFEIALGFVRCASLLSTVSASQRQIITEEEWLSLVEEEPQKSIRLNLLDWTKELAGRGLIEPRIGSKELMIEVIYGQKRVKILSISDRFWFYFQELRDMGWGDAAITQFREKVNGILGLGALSQGTQIASVGYKSLEPEDNLEAVKSLVLEVIQQIVKAKPSV